MAEKKVFDIAHPEQAQAVAKPKKILLQEPIEDTFEATTAPELTTKSGADVSPRKSMTIEPIVEDTAVAAVETVPESAMAKEADATETAKPEVAEIAAEESEPEPEEPATEEAIEPEDEKKPVEPEDEPEQVTPVKESFGMVDPGLDDSQRATAAAKEAMQEPKIYDTKAYYVPIGNSHHKHGNAAGAIAAGILTAAAVAVAVLYFGDYL